MELIANSTINHVILSPSLNAEPILARTRREVYISVLNPGWNNPAKTMKLSKWAIRIWAASSEFGIYRLCEQRRFRRACASAQSRENLRCSLMQAVSQKEPSDRKPDPWPLWMAGHAQLKFVMTECSKTQIRLTRPRCDLITCEGLDNGKKRQEMRLK